LFCNSQCTFWVIACLLLRSTTSAGKYMFLLLMFLLLLLFGVWRHAWVIGHCTAHCSKRIFSLPGALETPCNTSLSRSPCSVHLIPSSPLFSDQLLHSWFRRRIIFRSEIRTGSCDNWLLQIFNWAHWQNCSNHTNTDLLSIAHSTHTHTQILFHIKEFVTNTITLLNLSHCTHWFSLYW
jgi:hypothetical protein